MGPQCQFLLGQHFVTLQRPANLRRRCLSKPNPVFKRCDLIHQHWKLASRLACIGTIRAAPHNLRNQQQGAQMPRYIVLLKCLLQLPWVSIAI